MASSNNMAFCYDLNQGIQPTKDYTRDPTGHWSLLAPLPAVPGTIRFGPSVTANSLSNASGLVPSDNRNYGQQLTGAKRSHPGSVVSSNAASVQVATFPRKCSAALAPTAVETGQNGSSSNLSTIAEGSCPITEASCPEVKAPLDNSTAAQPQRVCANCGTNRCPANTWRAGPVGPRSLCNRCGINYKRHGAGALIPGSNAALAAAPELAAQPVAQLPHTQHRLARSSSSCNNYLGKPQRSAPNTAVPAAVPAVPLPTDMTFSDRSEAASAMLPRPSKKLKTSTTEDSGEHSNTRQVPRQKRRRDASGEVDCQFPGMVTRSRKLASVGGPSAALGGIRQAAPAAAAGLGASQRSHTGLQAPAADMHAEAVRLLFMVAPGASAVGVRKSRRVAQRKARQVEALKAHAATQAAAQEDDEAAQVLLDMANFARVDGLVNVLARQLDTV